MPAPNGARRHKPNRRMVVQPSGGVTVRRLRGELQSGDQWGLTPVVLVYLSQIEAGSGCLAMRPTSAAPYHHPLARMACPRIQVSLSVSFPYLFFYNYHIVNGILCKNSDTMR